jgi:pimeloyl-ACP methyl ester carboxylesterase
MKFIETTDALSSEKIKLSYEDFGQGKPVVLIHGWPLSKEMWEYQVPALVNAGFRVITYDRRGFGRSSKPWSGYDYDSLTDDLKAVIDQLSLTDVTLVGFSMGGGEVARYFAKYNGQNVSKAILISSIVPYLLKTDTNPHGVAEEDMKEWMKSLQNDRIGFLDNFGKTFFGINMLNHPVSAPLLNYYLALASAASPKATQDCMTAFGTTDFREDAAKINVPTLIIHGDSDKTVPIETSSEQAATLIPENTFIKYGGAPHGLFYTDKDKLNQDLIIFIKEGKIEPSERNYEVADLPTNEALITHD